MPKISIAKIEGRTRGGGDAVELNIVDGLYKETELFRESLQTEPAKKRMKKFIEFGGQTREGEYEWKAWSDMYKKLADVD
jgi:hypothetical protein